MSRRDDWVTFFSAALASANELTFDECVEIADDALDETDKRFPDTELPYIDVGETKTDPNRKHVYIPNGSKTCDVCGQNSSYELHIPRWMHPHQFSPHPLEARICMGCHRLEKDHDT